MVPAHRHAFNRAFNNERYRVFVEDVVRRCGVPAEFRLSETPCFFSENLIGDLTGAALAMVSDLLGDPAYRRAAIDVVPDRFRLANGEALPTFVQLDFGLVRAGGRIEGRLLNLQAFPSMYGFQLLLAEASLDTWSLADVALIPAGADRADYLHAVGAAILGGHDPAEVVLLEISPAGPRARLDSSATEKLWRVRAVDIRTVVRRGRHLFYDHDDRRVRIHRIYNRVVPEHVERLGIALPFDYRDDLDVEWASGPDWYFRVSPFALPWLRHPWVPRTYCLRDVQSPGSRVRSAEWVLKPVSPHAGGVVFDPTDADIEAIPADRRHLYVLQERVACTPVIDTPHGPREAEVSLMLLREGDGYRLMLPFARIVGGRAIEKALQPDSSWTGASAALIV